MKSHIWIATKSNHLETCLIWSWEWACTAGTGGHHHTWFYTVLQTEPWASCLLLKHSTLSPILSQPMHSGRSSHGNLSLVICLGLTLESMVCQSWLTLYLKGLEQKGGPIISSTSHFWSFHSWTLTLARSLHFFGWCGGLTCHWAR